MASRTAKRTGPTLEVASKRVAFGGLVYVRGSGWPVCPVELAVDGRVVPPAVVSEGAEHGAGLLPAGDGCFQCTLALAQVEPGRRTLVARSAHRSAPEARVTLQVEPEPESFAGPDADRPTARARHFFSRRFGELGAAPPGLREFQVKQVRELRDRARRRDGGAIGGRDRGTGPAGDLGEGGTQPAPGVCNWTPMGPSGVIVSATNVWSGRTLSIAFDPTAASTVYVGSAGGGVWKSTDGGENWVPKSDYQVSLAIGALAVDPNNSDHVLAGTGEFNNGYIGTYYGNGVLRSDNGGDTWINAAGATFARAEISRIAFDPVDPTGQHVLLSSSVGVFESGDGGTTWTPLRAGNASDLTLFSPTGGAPNRLTAIAGFSSSGLWTATRDAGVWSAWTQITGPAFPAIFDRIALGHQRADAKVIYALFATGGQIAGMARTLDGAAWTKVDIKLNQTTGFDSTVVAAHSHSVTIPAADLTAPPPAGQTYTTTSDGTPAHTHTLTLSQAQLATLAGGSAVLQATSVDSGHQHDFGLAITGQSGYNLCVGVHPTNADTAYFGEVRMWRTTGGGIFNPLPIPHTDEHGFAFEPTGTACWMVGDGGVYRSPDAGDTWVHRNRDLATLEYIGLAQHPEWETVLLGGTQDNGSHRYTGSPAWWRSAGGDGGFAAIDPVVPTRWYHEYVYSTFYRSDNAGNTWALTNVGVAGARSGFYAPFAIDPSNHDVCYFGGQELWRRDYSVGGSTWEAVTSGVATGLVAVTALAVDPSDATKVYVSTSNGKVFRVQRTGPTWAVADVTRTDISTGLPAGVSTSDLAVDGAGVVWVTVASVYGSEATGEFTNDHVFRRAPGDASFSSRSTGLAQANPVNSIVIDPTDANRLFCGCDVGVFRTEDAGLMWTPWDEGIPNVPVFDLVLHGPRRLLRAATHGRSVWERPIDAASCPMADLYVRDDLVDSGRVQPTPEGVPSPLDPATLTWHWQSPDIKVDAPEPTFQTATAITDYVSFEAAITHRTARRNRVNRFYVQVHNRGVGNATNVQVRAFFARAAGGLPMLPADFWSAPKPFVGTPSGTDWTPVGPAYSIPVLEPAKPAIRSWDWMIPSTAPEHSCLMVVTTCDQDAIAGGEFNADQLVLTRKQVALKNLTVLDPVPGGGQDGGQMILVDLWNPGDELVVADVLVHWGSLPPRAAIRAVFDRGQRVEGRDLARPARTGKKQERAFPATVEVGCGYTRSLARAEQFEVRGKRGEHALLADGLVIPPKDRRVAALRVDLPARIPREGVQFDVIQRVDGRVAGGCTYRIEPPPAKASRASRRSPRADS